jgi:glutaredoxin 3
MKTNKPNKVKLYATTTCPYCKMEAVWLNNKKVEFEEIHVDANMDAAIYMVSKTGQMGVPVTEIKYEDGKEEFIVGFDRSKLAQVLEVSL